MRILIVEDERKMALALKKGLEAENHCVTLADDGRTALARLSPPKTEKKSFGFANS